MPQALSGPEAEPSPTIRLRPSRNAGLLATNPFGARDFEGDPRVGTGASLLDGAETLELRCRVVMAAEELGAEAEYASFVGEAESLLH